MHTSHSTGENRLLSLAFTSEEAQKKAQSETQAYLASIAPPPTPVMQTASTPNYGTVDLKTRTYSTTPIQTSYTNTTGKLTPDNSTYGTPIGTNQQSTFTKPAFATLEEAQKAQQEYYLKHGATDPSIAADITNLGGGSGDFNQVDPYKQQTAVAPQPSIVNDAQRDIKTPGTGTFTIASAKYDLATSRDPRVKMAAQQFLDAEQNKIKGYIDRTWTDPKTGAIYKTKSEDPNATAEAQQQWLNRQATEEQNRLKIQENTNKMKDFTSGIDTSAFEMTKNQITEAMGMIKNLSPDLQSVVLPALLNLQESNNRINESALQMKSTLPTDKEIEAQYGSFEAYITKMDEKMTKMNEENKQLQLDVAKYNRDALEIDKQIIEHDAYVAEQKQMQANMENEKRLRRQLGKLGITTDVQGLDFLQNEIQKGADAYNELKKGNNLVSLKAQLAIGQGYALDVRKAISDYDAKDLQITSQTAEALMKVKQSISTAKSDRDKELRSILEKSLEKKDANDKEARKYVFDANMKMIDETNKLRDDKRAEQKDLVAEWDKHISNYGNTNKAGAEGILKRMTDAGMDIRGYNADVPTLSQSEKAAKNVAKTLISDNIGKYIDKESGLDLVSLLDSSTRDLTVGRVDGVVDTGLKLLQEGNITAFKSLLLANARGGMDTDTSKKVKVYDAFLRQMDSLEGTINAMSPDDFGWWKSVIEKGKTYTEVAKDPRFNKLKASIGFFQAQLRTPLFGAALSPQEKLLADDFLANFETDEMGTVVDKLNALRESLDFSTESAYDYQLGEGAYKKYIRGGNTKVSDIPDTPIYQGQSATDWFKGGTGSGSTTPVAPPVSSGSVVSYLSGFRVTQDYGGTYDQEHGYMEGPHNAIDLAPKVRGTPTIIPAVVKGKVVAMNNLKGLGNSISIKDDNGYTWEYGHLASQDVKVGDTVDNDSPLGVMGSTGVSTGIHLHLALKDPNGKYIDPKKYMKNNTIAKI